MNWALDRLEKALAVALVIAAPMARWWEVVARAAPQLNRDLTGGLIYLSDVVLLLLLGVFLLRSWRQGRPLLLGPRAIGLPLVTLALIASSSIAWAPSRSLAADSALRLLAMVGLYVVLASSGPAGRWWGLALVAGAAFEGALAVGQLAVRGSLGLSGLGEVIGGFWAGDNCFRAAGLSPNPNVLGGYLAVGALVTLGLRQRGVPGRVAAGLALVVILGGLLATGSRSALLALIAGLGVLLLARQGLPSRRWLASELVVAAGAMLIAGVTVGGCTFQRLAAPFASPVQAVGVESAGPRATGAGPANARWELLQVAVVLAGEHPLGVGAGNFTIAWLLRGGPTPTSGVYQPVHNVAALVAVETGLPGALAWAVLWLGVVYTAWRGRPLAWSQGVWAGALAAIFVVGLLDFYPWGWEQGRVLSTLVLGLSAWAMSERLAGEPS